MVRVRSIHSNLSRTWWINPSWNHFYLEVRADLLCWDRSHVLLWGEKKLMQLCQSLGQEYPWLQAWPHQVWCVLRTEVITSVPGLW